ncbi:MAG TPA: hypothetical protein VEZ11_17470 [Thermoanaerobaculia bacterium]|nr:hypothetical protein [Thermoanaerobaculia bacterium]
MTSGRKISFLPVFFTVTGVAFALVITWRVHSYTTVDARADQTGSSSDPASRRATAGRSTGGALTSSEADGTAGGAAAQTIASRGGVGVAESDRSRAAREQRFRELLAAGDQAAKNNPQQRGPSPAPPNQPPPPKPDPPSALQRLVAPIANLFSGNSASSSSVPSTPPPKTSTNTTSADPKDPTSDNTPPQLLSVEFSPPQIQDGQETMLVVMATDDISGIRNISGSVTSPTGKAMQGFSLQSDGVPNSNRYTGRVAVPKDAEAGIWRINFLSLTDNASNSANVSYAAGNVPPSATFRVTSSNSDSTPPTLARVWLDRTVMNAGDKNTLYVQADDDKSGVALVSGVFQSPVKIARIGFGCRPGAGDVWECDITMPKCLDCGNWSLEQVQLQDKANNMTTVRADNPLVAAVHLNVAGDSCDSTPPAMSTLILDPVVVSNSDISVITVTATVSDDGCGVASVSGQAAGPLSPGNAQPPRLYFSLASTGQGQVWTGKITVPKSAAKGIWNIVWFQVIDKGNNLKTYSKADPMMANAAFRVR